MRLLLSCLLLCGYTLTAPCQQRPAQGTYTNPILPGDFQNTDVIRVGSTYYYISATKELSPGMLIMQSKDLLSWTMIGHAVYDLTQIHPRYGYQTMQGSSRGIWAGAIRYHDNKFYVYFTDPDEGLFMTTASDPAGPWAPLTALKKEPGWDDPCPLWDDDGSAYLVMTHFSDNYKIHLFKMSRDGKTLDLASDQVIHQSKGSEANKLYKINGYYYHFYSEVTSEGRMPFMTRSKTIYGPYSERQKLINKAEAEPNQGGMIQTKKGDWYFVTHHGHAYWSGREVSLLPVTWVKGWPVWGTPDSSGTGNMLWSAKKPFPNAPQRRFQTSDEFTGKTLSPQWEWYFQPRSDKWSLTERPGYLRLHANRPLQRGVIAKTPNVLTQRPLRVDSNTVVLKLDVSAMADGQVAALALFGKTSASIGIRQRDGARGFYFDETGKITNGPGIPATSAVVWLKSAWDKSGKASFFYSVDGLRFVALGNKFQITNFGNFLGAKIGIFTANEQDEKGFVDVDWFRYTFNPNL